MDQSLKTKLTNLVERLEKRASNHEQALKRYPEDALFCNKHRAHMLTYRQCAKFLKKCINEPDSQPDHRSPIRIIIEGDMVGDEYYIDRLIERINTAYNSEKDTAVNRSFLESVWVCLLSLKMYIDQQHPDNPVIWQGDKKTPVNKLPDYHCATLVIEKLEQLLNIKTDL